MTGIHEFKIADSATVPDGPTSSIPGVVLRCEIVNIPDIHCVSRLALNDFNVKMSTDSLFVS